MRARATKPFFDIKEKADRAAGDVFECSEERFAEINSTAHGTLCEAVEEPKPARRRRRAPDVKEG